MKKKWILAAVTLFVTAGIWKSFGDGRVEPSLSSSDAVSGSLKTSAESDRTTARKAKQSTAGQESGPSIQAQALVQNSKSVTVKPIDPALTEDLKTYRMIQSKPFPTDAETAQRKALLKDAQFLKQAGSLLTDIALMQNEEYLASENAAIDVLLEALQSGNKAVAEEVIWAIVRDQQVESSLIPQKQRETLAGIKGELLYHATAGSRFPASSVSAALPGPVSARIWSNVQEQQQANLAESNEEVKAHEAKWKKGS